MNYVAPWWLPGGNLQTIWAALRSERFLGPRPRFRRERWMAPDSDFVDVDWLEEDGAPTLPTACGSLPPERAGLAWGGPARRPEAPMGAASDAPRRFAGRGSRDASPLSPVQTCSSRFGAAGSSPSGAELAWGGPALRPEAPTLSTATDVLHPRDAGVALGGPVQHSPAGKPPLLVVFHGLEGSSASHYAEAFADVARSRGWACAVPHFRGCSGELNLAPRAYHSGDFAEVDWILRRFARQHGGPVLAVGISLGGNALMRWGTELGAQARQLVAGIASVCSPLDLVASGWAIGRGFNRQVYTRMFLKTMVPKALQKLDQHPGLFDRDRLLAARDLYEFDNVFTAPVHGFINADDYWARASAKPHLHRIAIPALILNALNDPFIPAASLPRPADVSRHVTLWQPAQGGHVGFPSPPFPGHVRAMPEAVAAFLAAQL